MAKVSVVIPIYNVELYLSECLESIVNQTLKDIEIICVNDGSKDNSLEIIKSFAQKDSRIVIIDKQNEGYGKTVNRGIDIATGEYIGIVESDDFIVPDMYENLYNAAIKNNLDIVKCDFFNYFTSTSETVQCDQYPKKILNKVITPLENINEVFKLQPAIWSAIYKKEFLEKNNIKFLETAGASYQDISFAFKCYALAKNIMFINKPLLYYRQDNVNSSVNNKEKVFCIDVEYNEIDNFINENNLSQLKEISLYLRFEGYRWTLKRISSVFYSEFVDFMYLKFKNVKLTDSFISLFSKSQLKDFMFLLKFPKKYLSLLKIKSFIRKLKIKRKRIISIRKSSSKFQVIFLGKRII